VSPATTWEKACFGGPFSYGLLVTLPLPAVAASITLAAPEIRLSTEDLEEVARVRNAYLSLSRAQAPTRGTDLLEGIPHASRPR
jgi:hypothetical protein